MFPAAAPARVTEEEFLALPESHDRIELVDGEVIVSPSPQPLHQLLVGRLFRVLSRWADAHPPAFVGLSPLDLRLGPGRIVQPDLFLLAGGLPGLQGPIRAVPDLVVEVLSAARSYDRLSKRVLYAEAGVGEYWLVDPLERVVEIVVGLETAERADEMARSAVAGGLAVDVGALFTV